MTKWLFRINERVNKSKRLLVLLPFLLASGWVIASTDPVIVTVLKGSANSIKVDSVRETFDPVFYSANKVYIDDTTKDVYRNVIALLIDEDDSTYISADFTVSVWVKIIWTAKNGTIDSIIKKLEVNYKVGAVTKYNVENYFYFNNARRVKIEIDSIDQHGATWDATKVLRLENRMEVSRNYIFSCDTQANDVDAAIGDTTFEGKFDELHVTWAPQTFMGITHYDVEWAWVDIEALDHYKTGGQFDARLIFRNNSTRVTIPGNNTIYRVPLIYDGSGYLFYRVRPVQYREDDQIVEGRWSAEATSGITYYGYMDGHEPDLNWEVSTTYAEDGKRQTVIQYLDGTFRSRQTVTKDNTLDTARTIVVETLYDYQGRSAITILPAPTLNKVIEYAKNFNRFYTSDDPKNIYDLVPVGMTICNSNAPQLDSNYGAAKYYSSNNPKVNEGFNKYIPNAQGYPYSETRYVQDASGRVAAAGGVGPAFQLSTGHETKYFYGSADQRELDALFGTEVGDSSHYFKNMVRDANGQYSVSYVDMHGRTIATALAGNPPQNLDPLESYQPQYLTKNLLTNNIVKDRSIQSATTLLVPKAGNHMFHYELNPQSAEIIACNGDTVCYDCYYDLEIRITGTCGETPHVITRKNFSFGEYDTSCNNDPPSLIVDDTLYLVAGEYNITKILTLSRDAQDWYRDSVFMKKNICKTLEDYYNEIYTIMLSTSNCNLSCDSCEIRLGSYEHYRAEFLTAQGIDSMSTVAYEVEIKASYDEALANCKALCGNGITENKLDMIRQQMLIDMTPDQGQYAKLDKDLNENGTILPGEAVYAPGDDDHENPDWEVNSNRPYNIFNVHPEHNVKPFRYPVNQSDNTFYYKNQFGQKEESLYVIQADGVSTLLNVISPDDFSDQFDTSWAKSLLYYHPEYCKLNYAQQHLASSYAWDAKLEAIDKWHDAAAAGWITNMLALDPFFTGAGSDYAHEMEVLMNTNYRGGKSIWQMAWLSVNCRNAENDDCAMNAPSPPYDTSGCATDWDYVWRIFRTIYLSEKDRMVNELLKIQCSNIDYALLEENNYDRRFGSYKDFSEFDLVNLVASWNNASQGTQYGEAQAQLLYRETCDSYIELWRSRLLNCDALVSHPDSAQILNRIITQLKEICFHGADDTHPYGSSTVKPGDSYTPSSFEAVISSVFHEYGLDTSALCHPYIVDFPRPYDTQLPISDDIMFGTQDSCICARLHELQQEQSHTGYSGTLSQFIQYQHGIFIRQSFLDTIINACDSTTVCNLFDPPLSVPFILSCNTTINNCIDCSQYDTLKKKFKILHPSYNIIYEDPQDDAQVSQNLFFEAFMNYNTGLSKSWSEYLQFEKLCRAYDTGFWNCKKLDSIVVLFNQTYVNTGSVEDCREAFTVFFNTAFGTSYTFTQIQQLFMKYCGHLPDVCEPVLDCKGFHAVIDSFYHYYGDSIRTAVNCQALFVSFFNDYFGTNYTWQQLVDMYKQLCGGDLDVCNSVSCGRLQLILDTWHNCHNTDWLGVDCLELWVDYFNHVMGTNYTAAEIEALYNRCHIPYTPCEPKPDCKTLNHLLNAFNNANADSTACPAGVDSTCQSCFTWYINNTLGSSLTYEQIILMYQMSCGITPNVCDSIYNCKELTAFSYNFIIHYNSDSTFNCDSLFTAQFNAAFGTSYTFEQITAIYQLYCGQRPDVCRKEPVLNCRQIQAVYESFLELYPDPRGYFGDSCKNAFVRYFNQAIGGRWGWDDITLYYWNLCGFELNVCDTTNCQRLQVFLNNYDSTYSGYNLPHDLCRDLFTQLFNKEFSPRAPHTWKDIRRLYDSCHIALTICPADSIFVLDCSRVAGAKKAFMALYEGRLPANCNQIFTGLFNQYFNTSFTGYDQLNKWIIDNCGSTIIDTGSFHSSALNTAGSIDIVQEGDNYYAFTPNYDGTLLRLSYGNSLLNTPVATNLGSLGFTGGPAEPYGIDVEKDGNKWIGYAVGGLISSKLIKINFGSSLSNTPTYTDLGNIGSMSNPVDFSLYKDGINWYGLTVNLYPGSGSVTRFNFGPSLDSVPTGNNFGDVGGTVNQPVGIFLAKHESQYHLFVTNYGDYTISRLDFGTSLSNTPVGTNLGAHGAARDITIVEDKGKIYGYALNEDYNNIVRLDFSSITAVPTSKNLGNIANFGRPSGFSPMFKNGGAISFLVTNFYPTSISRISFSNELNCFCNPPADSAKMVLRTMPPVTTDSLPPRLCNTMPVFPPVTADEGDPCDFIKTLAWNSAVEHYNLYVENQKDNFDKAYQEKCLSAANLESFTVKSEVAEHHFTLYYYDQAGNLVKTVPPAGVKPDFSDAFYHNVEAAKKDGAPVVPAHTLVTQYRYNTLNQVIEQISPDGGVSRFWYDRLGRLAVSQNAKQAADSLYSYTKYDRLARIIEVGQLTGTHVIQALTQDTTALKNWFAAAASSCEQIINTVYDEEKMGLGGTPSILNQKNLRNRVSYTTITDHAGEEYASATYFSYDIHGNVDTLLQHYNKGIMHDVTGNAFKKMIYKYDLRSSKINEMVYQAGIRDQFYHRYEYDAKNRLIEVYTSHDYVYWERQAAYQYYLHGPLARAEIGQLGVQGEDYAYTLQGWLKGVNSTTATNSFDMGGDGALHRRVAKDAYGFSLNYYANYVDAGSISHSDYNCINAGVNPFAAISNGLPQLNSDGIITGRDLFNGNIRAMLVNIPAVGGPRVYGYSYDQLNRIRAMNAYDSLNITTNVFTPTALKDYSERVNYDPNGNILSYKRNATTTSGRTNAQMDDMHYLYYSGTNRLRRVRDDINSSFTSDIEDMENQGDTLNYKYDAIGNLVVDKAGNIYDATDTSKAMIEWTVYGKISKVVKIKDDITTVVRYTYDAGGNRISKVVKTTGKDSTYTWYVRDASGNVMAVYERGNDSVNNGNLSQTELHLYGSSRIGIWRANRDVQKVGWEFFESTGMTGTDGGHIGEWQRGQTVYELSNHLGNVLVTISDRKISIDNGSNGFIDYYEADIVSANDYYPFGMMMPGRKYSGDDTYRYGFNGKEESSEISSDDYDLGARIYDGRIGRFLSTDPRKGEYAWQSPFAYFANSPVSTIDVNGEGGEEEEPKPIALGFYGGANKPGDNGAFKIALQNTQKSYGTAYIKKIDFAKTGEYVVDQINAQKPNTIARLDIITHSSPTACYMNRHEDTKETGEYKLIPEDKREGNSLYASKTARALESWGNGPDQAVINSIDYENFTEDCIIELHGCKVSAGTGYFVDNLAENLSDYLYDEGKKNAVVIGHSEKANPSINGDATTNAQQDYRHGLRVVYHNGEVLFKTRVKGNINKDVVKKYLDLKKSQGSAYKGEEQEYKKEAKAKPKPKTQTQKKKK